VHYTIFVEFEVLILLFLATGSTKIFGNCDIYAIGMVCDSGNPAQRYFSQTVMLYSRNIGDMLELLQSNIRIGGENRIPKEKP
jgi:hypothetical protein